MKKILVIGGGAAGMACAVMLARGGASVKILERGERLGRKLSATGNGQGNVTNLQMGPEFYFSDEPQKVARALSRFGARETISFLESMGGIFLPDGRGRVYPAGRQASAVTDLFRMELARLGVETVFGAQVTNLTHKSRFTASWQGGREEADAVVLCAGGRAAPNFGTDGAAYALAEKFGHTVSAIRPALVPLKCDPSAVRGLKGIRMDCTLRARSGGKPVFEGRGDFLFAEGGISGDVVFRASSYVKKGDTLEVDFLPDVPEKRLYSILSERKGEGALLCIVPNGLGRFLYARAGGDVNKLISLLKAFPLTVEGDFGFARAQVTKGGIPLAEVDDSLQSNLVQGLYFAGEILNVDGACGGYNLQWAFTSAHLCVEGMLC